MINRVKEILNGMENENILISASGETIWSKYINKMHTETTIVNDRPYICISDNEDALETEYYLSESMISNIRDYNDGDIILYLKGGTNLLIEVQM